jgi:hypothetical protein
MAIKLRGGERIGGTNYVQKFCTLAKILQAAALLGR